MKLVARSVLLKFVISSILIVNLLKLGDRCLLKANYSLEKFKVIDRIENNLKKSITSPKKLNLNFTVRSSKCCRALIFRVSIE